MRFVAKLDKRGRVRLPKAILDCYSINYTDYIEFEVIKVKKV